jgi:hypothetical protein
MGSISKPRRGGGASPLPRACPSATLQRGILAVICLYMVASVVFIFFLHTSVYPPSDDPSWNRVHAAGPGGVVLGVPPQRPAQPETPRQDLPPMNTVRGQQHPAKAATDTAPQEVPTAATGNSWQFDRQKAEERLSQPDGPLSIRKPITAYVEGPMHAYLLNTGDRGDFSKDKDKGTPPEYVIPLPLRTQSPEDLQRVEYPKVQTCADMPAKFPVDRGLELDAAGNAVVWNVGGDVTPPDFPQQEMPFCPVEADPYLPWIHDLFPSVDGKRIHVLAQNTRRCRTGKQFTENVNRLLPQISLMQAVSVERLSEDEAQQLAPSLWKPSTTDTTPRYRLSPVEDASPDGRYTRFICRFHSVDFETGQDVILDETLSVYPFNYELAAYRKGQVSLHTPKGKDTTFFWTSNLRFDCPVPESLQSLVASGSTVLSDQTPTLWLDIVPIRTPPRYLDMHFGREVLGPFDQWAYGVRPWNATLYWGSSHVVPRVEASGRWTNLPICKPPSAPTPKETTTEKPHYLSACLWASAEFKTRGLKKGGTTDTADRLKEWLTFHLLVGFDHVYVYDNSGAHRNDTNLEGIISQFPPGKVTRIDWPSTVCNNNIPAHDSTGERSSQYAAENSCRTRYAPFTEWISAFDTDEYFVPMGDNTDLRDVLRKAAKEDTNILSFRSSRAKLRRDASVPVGSGRVKLPNTTFLEAYNCDGAGSPKPAWADRARKQIYRADYVLYHFVHYSTVTLGHTRTFEQGQTSAHYGESGPSERNADEFAEAVMVHTKTIQKDMTNKYETKCRNDYEKKWQGCWVANPWPEAKTQEVKEDADGMEYNCFINQKVEDYWIPKLRQALLLS